MKLILNNKMKFILITPYLYFHRLFTFLFNVFFTTVSYRAIINYGISIIVRTVIYSVLYNHVTVLL